MKQEPSTFRIYILLVLAGLIAISGVVPHSSRANPPIEECPPPYVFYTATDEQASGGLAICEWDDQHFTVEDYRADVLGARDAAQPDQDAFFHYNTTTLQYDPPTIETDTIRQWWTYNPDPDPGTPPQPLPPGLYVATHHWDDTIETPAGRDDPEITDSCTIAVVRVNLTAYRQQTLVFRLREVPEDQEETPGAGIRVNGDDDNRNSQPDSNEVIGPVSGEDDLIQLRLDLNPAPPPTGLQYMLRKTGSAMRVYSNADKTDIVMGMSTTEHVLVNPTGQMTLWVELPLPGASASLELIARDVTGQNPVEVTSDRVNFYQFENIVIGLGGEGQNPIDPADGQFTESRGFFWIPVDLYEKGYDVYMYDEDVVNKSGAGAAYDNVVSAIEKRDVANVAIFGYSHGGGSTYDLAERLADKREEIEGEFAIVFTGYIDAIKQDFGFEEDRYPPDSAYHANYYQRDDWNLEGTSTVDPKPADFEVNVNETGWGADLNHYGIDDAEEVQEGMGGQVEGHVDP